MLLRTPIDLGSAIRDRRRRLHLGQDELAVRVGVSRKWIVDVEKGRPRVQIGLVLRTLEALGLRVSLEGDEASERPANRIFPSSTLIASSTAHEPIGRARANRK